MEHVVAFMIGATASVMGLSFLLHSKAWSGYMAYIREKGEPAALMIGYMHLLIGTFIVGAHWKWQGLPLLLTLLGVKAILEGITYSLFPGIVPKMLGWFAYRHRHLFPVIGIITTVIGLLVLSEWWQYMQFKRS